MTDLKPSTAWAWYGMLISTALCVLAGWIVVVTVLKPEAALCGPEKGATVVVPREIKP
jgi:hypothetical protein